MSAIELARAAYISAYTPVQSNRSAEYRLFSEITARLQAAAHRAETDADNAFAGLAAALHDNRMLWTLLASDVADNGNLLSGDLRARVFFLAEFTNAHSRKVMRGTASADVLIEVNTSMMRGLNGQPVAGVA